MTPFFFYWWGSFGEIHRHCWKERLNVRILAKFESDSSEASVDIALRSWGILQLLPSTIQTSVNCCDFPALYLRYFATSLSQTWHIYYFKLSFQAVSTNFHQLIHVKSWKTVEGSFKCWPRFSREKGGVFSFFLAGYNFYGTERMYSGTDGREFEADIFFGIVYYQRLRHMVADKYQVPTPPLLSSVVLSHSCLSFAPCHGWWRHVCVLFVWLVSLSYVMYSACWHFWRFSVLINSYGFQIK